MSDTVNIFNARSYRESFCRESGHTHECVEDTVDKMVDVMAKCSKYHNIPIEYAISDVYSNIDVEVFNRYLCRLLSVKTCGCKSGVTIQ